MCVPFVGKQTTTAVAMSMGESSEHPERLLMVYSYVRCDEITLILTGVSRNEDR